VLLSQQIAVGVQQVVEKCNGVSTCSAAVSTLIFMNFGSNDRLVIRISFFTERLDARSAAAWNKAALGSGLCWSHGNPTSSGERLTTSR
jgi:undecaprenyl pyrophosphate phosphatase UppP